MNARATYYKAKIAMVQEVLRRWDPIGIRPGEDGPKDEYDSYAPHIVTLLNTGTDVPGLAAHLRTIRTDSMGLGPNDANDQRFATRLIELWRGGSQT